MTNRSIIWLPISNDWNEGFRKFLWWLFRSCTKVEFHNISCNSTTKNLVMSSEKEFIASYLLPWKWYRNSDKENCSVSQQDTGDHEPSGLIVSLRLEKTKKSHCYLGECCNVIIYTWEIHFLIVTKELYPHEDSFVFGVKNPFVFFILLDFWIFEHSLHFHCSQIIFLNICIRSCNIFYCYNISKLFVIIILKRF